MAAGNSKSCLSTLEGVLVMSPNIPTLHAKGVIAIISIPPNAVDIGDRTTIRGMEEVQEV